LRNDTLERNRRNTRAVKLGNKTRGLCANFQVQGVPNAAKFAIGGEVESATGRVAQ